MTSRERRRTRLAIGAFWGLDNLGVNRRAVVGVLMMALAAYAAGAQDKDVSPGSHEPKLRCHDSGVRLDGTLLQRWFYGPPGFGEARKRDARERVFVLRLAYPVTVVAPSDASKDETCADVLKHVTEIQVWAFEKHLNECGRKLESL